MKKASFIKSLILAFICTLSAIVSSCSEKPRETPTEGSLVMMTAEDIYPVIDLQVQTFTRIYEKAKISDLQTSTASRVEVRRFPIFKPQRAMPLYKCSTTV